MRTFSRTTRQAWLDRVELALGPDPIETALAHEIEVCKSIAKFERLAAEKLQQIYGEDARALVERSLQSAHEQEARAAELQANTAAGLRSSN